MLGETGRRVMSPIRDSGDFLAYGSPSISALSPPHTNVTSSILSTVKSLPDHLPNDVTEGGLQEKVVSPPPWPWPPQSPPLDSGGTSPMLCSISPPPRPAQPIPIEDSSTCHPGYRPPLPHHHSHQAVVAKICRRPRDPKQDPPTQGAQGGKQQTCAHWWCRRLLFVLFAAVGTGD